MDAPFGSWGTQTFIAGLTSDALRCPDRAVGHQRRDGWRGVFAAYIAQVLVPELAPGTVVILDNLATHKTLSRPKPCAMQVAGFSSCPPTTRT